MQWSQLLNQKEDARLEFKSQFYRLYDGDNESKRRQKHELIKDILSLANGNESVAGEIAYLIIGVDNKINEFGQRKLYDTSQTMFPTEVGFLGMVNALCDPPLSELKCYEFDIDDKQLFVIEIPPSPHLHETTEKLETPTQTYSKYVTLVRHNEGVDIASAKQREAILNLKKIKIAEMENPPDLVGGVVGFALGYIAGGISPFPLTEDKSFNEEISPYFGGVTGSLLGTAIGFSYRVKYQLQKKYPKRMKAIESGWLFTVLMGGFLALFGLREGLEATIKRIAPYAKIVLKNRAAH